MQILWALPTGHVCWQRSYKGILQEPPMQQYAAFSANEHDVIVQP